MVLLAALGGLLWAGRSTDGSGAPPAAAAAWAALDPQGRCDSAAELITHPDRWPTRCRWRMAGEPLLAQSFPPPKGPPPYDEPRVEVYVTPEQGREELANVIAHELGHMHHTREPAFSVADWLAARNLGPQDASEIWTEDYAEVFATLFSPPAERWRAPTPRPGPEALAALKARFFSPGPDPAPTTGR